jgi:hypothetical protein
VQQQRPLADWPASLIADIVMLSLRDAPLETLLPPPPAAPAAPAAPQAAAGIESTWHNRANDPRFRGK